MRGNFQFFLLFVLESHAELPSFLGNVVSYVSCLFMQETFKMGFKYIVIFLEPNHFNLSDGKPSSKGPFS
jgi:hypothetical protein